MYVLLCEYLICISFTQPLPLFLCGLASFEPPVIYSHPRLPAGVMCDLFASTDLAQQPLLPPLLSMLLHLAQDT